MKNKKLYIVIGILIVVIIVAMMGFDILKKLPQVSAEKINEVSRDYLERVTQLKERLDDVIDTIDEYDSESWNNFSTMWIQEFNKTRPEEFIKRVDSESTDIILLFNQTNLKMYQLWIELNENFNDNSENISEIRFLSDELDKLLSAIDNMISN